MARKALVDGLVRFDEARGWRGAQQKLDLPAANGAWRSPTCRRSADVQPWRLAVGARGRRRPGRASACSRSAKPPARSSSDRETGAVTADGVKWTRRTVDRALCASATSSMSSRSTASRASSACARCPRSPAPSSPWTRIPAASTPWSAASPSTRASSTGRSQALRQPGSSFKPFVYATALDNGYTPSSVDPRRADRRIDMGPGQEAWTPTNYDGKSAGPRTLRYGIEHSKNLMTVRLAQGRRHAADRGICPPLRRLRRHAADPLHVARGRRDDGDAHDRRLFDVRQWRPAHQADADRPHSGPLRPDHLPPRRPQVHGCDAENWTDQAEPKLVDDPRAGARSADRLSDHLDARRRGPARHGAGRSRRSASRSPARPAPRTRRRTSGSSASRPTSRSASSSATTSRNRSAARRPPASTPRRSSATSCRWR